MERKKYKEKYILQEFRSGLNQYATALFTVGLVATASTLFADNQNYHVVSYLLLFTVSILSTFLGVAPVLVASTVSALAWNFFFIPPHYTFKIEKTEDILIFGLFFIIALVSGVLTTRIRRQQVLASEREKRTNALFQLTRALSGASGINEVLRVSIEQIKAEFMLDAVFYLQNGNNVLIGNGRLRENNKLNDDEYNIAVWVFKNNRKAGAFTDYMNEGDKTFYPLFGNRICPGVLVVNHNEALKNEQKWYWETFVAQISNALEREFLGEMAQKVRFLDESDRLYKTLFNSISHEFRIPVATIMGASDSILNSAKKNDSNVDLVTEIFTASVRLNRLIENLLNISRLESGHISIRLDWYDVNDLVNKVIEDLKDELKPFNVKTIVDNNVPLVKIDFGLMEQVLYNLVFNSTQYAPPASEIKISFSYSDNFLFIKVQDKGPGFSENELPLVFKKFFRANKGKTGGLGLGLSIVKGFVEAHNGIITVVNEKNGGAVFTIKVPTESPTFDSDELI